MGGQLFPDGRFDYQLFSVSVTQALETVGSQTMVVLGTTTVPVTLAPLTDPEYAAEVGATDVSVVVLPVFPDVQETLAVPSCALL